MGTPDITDRLAAVLHAPLEALGLDLEAVDLSKAGKRSVLRVAVDKDGGVDMDDIAEATKAFTLEVSSPGVDRPLTLPRHWRRNETRLVKVDLNDGETVTGRIVAAGDSGATLAVEGGEQVVAYEAIARAKIQIEFKREG
jgi:ribosome maturation factor RimP